MSAPSSVEPVAPPLPVGAEIGPFRLMEVIGMGGMGVVYRAHDTRLDREVALKVLPFDSSLGEPAQEALLREARHAAAVAHPNIASVYEAGHAGGRAYLAMELLSGSSLRARLQGGHATLDEKLDWAAGIARALASIHARGWIHLDVKPENVMIGSGGEAKLLDFGLARSELAADIASAGGTLPYMAPEQRQGKVVDARADVFAFGVLLQELLTGERSRTLARGALARAWRPVVAKCLEAQPERRFRSGGELEAALDAARRRALGRSRARALPVVFSIVLVALVLAGVSRWRTTTMPSLVTGPSIRLTGNRLERPISAAAISWDGKRLAYVDDDGLMLGVASISSRAFRVPFDELIVFVEALPRSTDWVVLTRASDETMSLWRLDERGAPRGRLYRGKFEFASLHPEGHSVVVVEKGRNGVTVRHLPTGEVAWALPIPQGAWAGAAFWSPDGSRLVVGHSALGTNGRIRALDVWDVLRREMVHSFRSPRLAQAYSPAVFGWAPDSSLLYALADAPGEGNGAAVVSQAFDPRGKPISPVATLATFERQLLADLGMASTGQLLTLRHDVRVRVCVSDILDSGELGARRVLTDNDFDERSPGFASSDALWLMYYREFVPHVGMRSLTSAVGPAEHDSRAEARGWAQSWPVPVAKDNGVLYWAAEGTAFEPQPRWQLVLEAERGVSHVPTPEQPREPLAAMETPPVGARVRCASRAPTCLLSTFHDDGASIWRLSLEGGDPSLLFRVPSADSFSSAWQVSSDGTRIWWIGRDAVLSEYDLHGSLLRSKAIHNLPQVRSIAVAETRDSFYLAGITDSEHRIVRITGDDERILVRDPAVVYGDLALSGDERRLSFVERAFDTDVWLTALRR